MKAVKIPVYLFVLILCLCLNALAQTDKETKKWIADKLEKSAKTFRATASGERDTYFYVKFDGCKVSVTRAETFTSGNLSATAYANGAVNPADRLVSYSRYNYSFNLSDVDFDNIKFSAGEKRSEIILPIVGNAKLVRAGSHYNGIKSVRFQSRFIFQVDETDGEKIAEQLKVIARKCREN